MALPDLDTSVGHSFGLEIDGVVIKQILEVSGLKMEQDVIELKQDTNDGKYVVKKLPGRPKAGEVTLTRGLTADRSFEKWIKDFRADEAQESRKNGAIIVYDFEGSAIKRFRLTNAWPRSLEVAPLKAGDISVLTEKLSITYETLEVE
jgi:phage tail-like protein